MGIGHYTHNTTYISTLEGPGSISYGQYLDRTLGKFPPLYGAHLYSLDKCITSGPDKAAIYHEFHVTESPFGRQFCHIL